MKRKKTKSITVKVKGKRRSPKTEFKKGQRGLSWVPIGTTKIVNDHGKIRRKVKAAELSWVLNSAYVWKQKYGKIIKGDVIHHINGNVLNDSIDNLIALPRSHHPIFHNKWWLKILNLEQIEYYLSRYTNHYENTTNV